MDSFAKDYDDLNDDQRDAVEAIDGPVLVVAGPGTGKTQLLGMRVANILRKTDTDAAAILCLTFTNKAATNMRDRLQRLVGPAGRNVMVRTFHSFAAEVMNIYPDYFWNGARLRVAPDAVQLELIESVLSTLPLSNPLSLKFAGQFTGVRDVQQGLKLAKEAGLTPDKLRAIINLNLAYIDEIEPLMVEALSPTLGIKKLPTLQAAINDLPSQGLNDQSGPLRSLQTVLQESLAFAISQDEVLGKTTNTGKWKRHWLQNINKEKRMYEERKRNEWWLHLADVYELYRKGLHARGYYDYSDMLVEVITQLEQHADLLASVQERFLYVLIDEFQDTNAAQLRLSHLVADHYSDAGNPNIMAVGDDDQSIYKFNGAELNNMLLFRSAYPKAKLFILHDNYRSSQAVLDTAKQVIELSSDRLVLRQPELNKDLIAKREPKKIGQRKHQIYLSRDHQLSAIARQLKQQRESSDDTIAVLARSHESLRNLASILSELRVPITYEQSNDIFAHEAVQQIINLSETVLAIQAGDEKAVNHQLVRALRHPMWGLSPELLWHLAAQNFGRRQWLDSLLNSSETQVQNIGKWLLWLAAEADYQPLAVMLEYLIGLRPGEHLTSPLREYYLAGDIDERYILALSAIKLLRGLAADFSPEGQNSSLSDLTQLATVMRNNAKIIADESSFVAGAKTVELYTVYKAKGLEFDSVYIIDAVEKNWQPKSGGRKPPANLPLQPIGDDQDDYVRLMYVAITRAKRDVIVSSYESDDAGGEVLPTPLIREVFGDIETPASVEPVTVLEEALRWPRLGKQDEAQVLRPKLENYHLSATHLLNFLDVTTGGPENFLEYNLLGLPSAQTPQLAFGNAMHAALETGQKLMNRQEFTLDAVIAAYDRALVEQQLPAQEFERYILHGQDTIHNLFDNLSYQLVPGNLPEQHLGDIRIGKAQLDGKLDRIDISDNDITVVDYKTGQPLSSFATRDQTKQIKAWRHKTQLTFYALLLRNSSRYGKVGTISGKMVYLEAETAKELERSYAPSDDDIERLSRLAQAVSAHILDLNLPDTSTYEQDFAGIQQLEQDLLDGKI